MARLVDGSGQGGEVAVVSLSPPDEAGLVVRRRPLERRLSRPGRPPVRGPGRPPVLAARSALVVGDAEGLEFFEVRQTELTRVAASMGRMSHLLSVVMHPAGASPGRTALAVALADLLRAERGAGFPVVTCGVRPLAGARRSAVPHAVRVADGTAMREVIVWEVVAWDDLPTWLGALSVRRIAA
ncbi:hypothetical protein I6A84_30485 [Frankia sp. CNm7]|nr:hypothetical protein [Frankia nepalensis]